MTIRDRLKEPATQMRLGLVFLILASLAKLLSHRLTTDIDLATGFLYGTAIGLLLLSMWTTGRRRSTSPCGRE